MEEIEIIYAEDALQIVNALFDKNLLHPNLSRADLRTVEDYLAIMIQHRVQGHIRGVELVQRLKRDRVIP